MFTKLIVGTVAGLLSAAMAVVSVIGGVGVAQAVPLPQDDKPSVAWIGAILADLTPAVAKRLGLEGQTGVVVVRVLKGSAAEQGGLQEKDIVKAIGGQPVEKAQEANRAIARAAIGQPLTITVRRGTAEQTVTVTPVEMPARVKLTMVKKRLEQQVMARRAVAQRAARLNRLPGWKDIPPDQKFSHTLGTTFRYKDKDGNLVTVQTIPGLVVSASATSITITPNDPALPGGPFAITEDTVVRAGKDTAVESLQAGDQVLVVTADGKTALAVLKSGPRPVQAPAGGE